MMIYILLYSSILSFDIRRHLVTCNSILNPPAIIETTENSTELPSNSSTNTTTEEIMQIVESSTVKISTEASDLDEVTKYISSENSTQKSKIVETPVTTKPKIDQLLQEQIVG